MWSQPTIAHLLSSPFMWLKRAPSKPQRMPMRANINISTMLYLVCCAAKKTTDQEQNSWSDKLAWQKGNSLVKFINGKSLPVWQSIYPYCSSICRSQCHKLNKLNKLKTTRSFTNASLNASPWNETSVNLPKLTGTPVPNLAKVRLTRQTGDQTLGDQAMSQTSSL